MGSNSESTEVAETGVKTVPCKACYGLGTVEIDGWESDCLVCQGWGDLEIPT